MFLIQQFSAIVAHEACSPGIKPPPYQLFCFAAPFRIKNTNQLSRQGRRIVRPCARHFQDFLLGIQHEGTSCLTHTPDGLVTFCASVGMVPFAPKQLLATGYQAPRLIIRPSPDWGSTIRLTREAFNPWRMWCIQEREEPMNKDNQDKILRNQQKSA